MGTEIKSTEKSESLDDFLDFYIEKTYQSFYESGKIIGHAFITCLLFLSLTAILIYGKGLEDKVSVPFLQLTLSKIYAAVLTLLFSCAAIFWFRVSSLINNRLADELRGVLKKRYDVRIIEYGNWSLSYPSILIAIFMSFITRGRSLQIHFYLSGLFTIGSYILPLLLAWKIGVALQFSFWQKFLMCAITSLLLLPAAIVQYLSSKYERGLDKEDWDYIRMH